jgi:hypothetical protein
VCRVCVVCVWSLNKWVVTVDDAVESVEAFLDGRVHVCGQLIRRRLGRALVLQPEAV